LGDTLYQEDTNQIIVCSNATGPVWKTYEANGELAYPSGLYTAGTPYVITTQPDMHYDGSRINGADASGNPAVGDAVSSWQDRSGNSRDADQATGADQGSFVKMGGYGVRMPSSTTLGFYDTNHTFASGSDGMTVIVAVTPPNYNYYAGVVAAAKTGNPTPAIFADAGIMMTTYSVVNLANLTQSYYASSYTTISRQGPRIITVLDGDGDQKVFEGTQVGYTNTASRTPVNIDNALGGDWFLGEGYQHFGATANNGGGGIFYEVLIFRGLLGYTVDGNGDLDGGEMNTVVNYLANKYGIPATHPYES
jgi:hypothetical protein